MITQCFVDFCKAQRIDTLFCWYQKLLGVSGAAEQAQELQQNSEKHGEFCPVDNV